MLAVRTFHHDMQKDMDEAASEGFRLVTVKDKFVYMEKPVDESKGESEVRGE